MSTNAPAPPPAAEPPPGYLSEASKRRFTVVAGVLGAVTFLAQMVLPAVILFALMMPAMFSRELKQTDVDGAALWQGDVWLTEETTRMSGADKGTEKTSLVRLRPSDLEPAGAPVPIGQMDTTESHVLLPIGDRLWIVGTDAVRYYDGRSVTRLEGAASLDRTSRPFAYGGLPAFLTVGWSTTLSTLAVTGARAEWTTKDLDLGLPSEAGSLHALQALEADGRLLLFAQVCTTHPEQCSIRYRPLDDADWRLATDERCSGDWSAVVRGAHPVLVVVENDKGRAKRFATVTLGPGPIRREAFEVEGPEFGWKWWRALSSGERLHLLTGGGFGSSLRISEVADGRVVGSVKKTQDDFPFGAGMFAFMVLPQVLPLALSFVLAFVLTLQMRRHRVGEFVHGDERRPFATLWQRALAQAVDAIPFAIAFLLPVAAMWRLFSDPERLVESGSRLMYWLFGGFAAALLVSAAVLVAYSYFEGRSGRTPGKRLMGIRVVGTDLQPCGFGRAILRNALMFVDGFFNFLVGALMVAFTENWQRLGDFAARTVVVADEKA